MMYLEDIDDLRRKIYIGQKVKVRKSDVLWERNKNKITGTVCEKYKKFIVCKFQGGILESFTYQQILTGDGIWLV